MSPFTFDRFLSGTEQKPIEPIYFYKLFSQERARVRVNFCVYPMSVSKSSKIDQKRKVKPHRSGFFLKALKTSFSRSFHEGIPHSLTKHLSGDMKILHIFHGTHSK